MSHTHDDGTGADQNADRTEVDHKMWEANTTKKSVWIAPGRPGECLRLDTGAYCSISRKPAPPVQTPVLPPLPVPASTTSPLDCVVLGGCAAILFNCVVLGGRALELLVSDDRAVALVREFTD